MFGSLITDQQNELLTFVDTDPAAALSRSRRSKPHVSCGFCRARKIKCSGEATGCERCIAAGIECQYPARESRRKKCTQSNYTRDSTTNSNAGSETAAAKEGDRRRPPPAEDEFRQPSPFPLGNHERPPLGGDRDLDMLDLITDLNSEQFNIDRGIPPPSADSISGLDVWEYNDAFSGSASPMALLGYNNNSEVMFGNADKALEAMITKANASMRGHSSSSASPYTSSPSAVPSDDLMRRSRAGTVSTQAGSQLSAALDDHGFPRLTPPQTVDHLEQHSPDGCNCLQLTARFLESLGAKSGSTDAESLDALLCYLRGALNRFSSFLECKQCSSTSSNSMLVAMAGRYISTLYEHLIKSYVRMLGDYAPLPFPDSSGEGVHFLSYRIEDAYEQMQVLRCLVSIQLDQFWRLLEKLKARPGTFNGHLDLLAEAEKRVQEAGSILRAALDKCPYITNGA
ncbi:hypothetical protein GGS23DRAFT_201855 [Durotheca rogersii]|uniref:uncharacterized protein n=1 Tax=Durotheca rogersii TaxID=419775 RepID=UPI002220E6FF|nr:uncharacterized protein GGS23DRAFT_201855 [Durotheca rogersii]KAI5867875.1 hypothetical protein GGS23DRAFT_201855 [Durotheca rogersii]